MEGLGRCPSSELIQLMLTVDINSTSGTTVLSPTLTNLPYLGTYDLHLEPSKYRVPANVAVFHRRGTPVPWLSSRPMIVHR